jgi:hypothetical protein
MILNAWTIPLYLNGWTVWFCSRVRITYKEEGMSVRRTSSFKVSSFTSWGYVAVLAAILEREDASRMPVLPAVASWWAKERSC